MLVVADSSPLIGLTKIGQLGVLPKLYGVVAIPTEVAEELADPKRPIEIRKVMEELPAWLIVRRPSHVEAISGLDPGEQAAISLTRELCADLLLIDETRGRQAAVDRGIIIRRGKPRIDQ